MPRTNLLHRNNESPIFIIRDIHFQVISEIVKIFVQLRLGQFYLFNKLFWCADALSVYLIMNGTELFK